MGSPPNNSPWSEVEDSNIRPSGLPLDSIQEDTEPPSTAHHSRRTKSSIAWPFHTRNASESASTTLSQTLRKSWNPRNLFRMGDDNESLARSIVPDYVIHYMRGETPETLAQKRLEREQDEQRGDAHLLRRRGSLASTPVEFGDLYSSSTDLTRGGSSSRSHRSRYLSGWRGGIRLNAMLIAIIFVVILSCFLAAAIKTMSITGDIPVYVGTCSGAKQTSIGIHVVINIVIVGILAATNYTLQVFSAPTREELDAAHEKNQWLDIGLPSFRNFRNISGARAALSTIATVCAVGGPVIYNGVIFETKELDGRETCGINASIPMLLAATALTFVILMCTSAAFFMRGFDPIVTIGDAIRSFLRVPDQTTAQRCLLTKWEVKQGKWGSNEAKYFTRGRHFWFLTPSFTRWILTALSFLSVAAPATVAVIVVANSPDAGEGKFPPLGLTTTATTFIFPSIAIDSLVPRVILSCLPHLLLAILYLATNSIFTTYYLSHEFSTFARERRQLRVSSKPVSAQTSTLYLTLPRPMSWFLLALFTTMGIILSQCVFPIMAPAPAGGSSVNPEIQIGLSSTALVVFLGLLSLLLVIIIGMGFRRAPSAIVGGKGTLGNPLALVGGSCSAVISARCHGRPDEDGRGALSWGVVDEARGMAIGHCAFSRREVSILDTRGLYA